MSRQRVVFMSLLAVFVASMFTTAVASAAGPFWHVNGTKLVQGSVGISGQNKGNLVLKGTVLGLGVTVTCTASHSVGTIDGQGATLQGQDKGKVKYEGCTAATSNEIKPCEVANGTGIIETNQLKSHLAFAQVQGTEQIVDLFEPSASSQTTERIFANINLKPCAGATGIYPVKGSVVGQLSPQEANGQEGSLFFPEPAITSIKHEGQVVTTGLTLGTAAATFTGFYGQKIQIGTFGVFRN